MEHFLHAIVLPSRIRADRGTETGVMCTIHSYLRAQHGDVENEDDCMRFIWTLH